MLPDNITRRNLSEISDLISTKTAQNHSNIRIYKLYYHKI